MVKFRPHPPRARNVRGHFVLVCIAGVFGAWNMFLSTYSGITSIQEVSSNQSQEATLKEWRSLVEVREKRFQEAPRSGGAPSPVLGADNKKTRIEEYFQGFPVTRFTPHVMELVNQYNFSNINKCTVRFDLTITQDPSRPIVNCTNTNKRGLYVSDSWCTILKCIFWNNAKKRTLPYNVSFAVSALDFLWDNTKKACIGSSNDGGEFCLTNFLEMKMMANNLRYSNLAWQNRSSIPIFRGAPWVDEDLYADLDMTNESSIYSQVLDMSPRLKAVDYSFHNPTLLNARVHQGPNLRIRNDSIWCKNSTTGLHKLLEYDRIPDRQYYENHQVALVLCGIGAAFRTSSHFSVSTAIVLQDCDKKEWFTGMLTPFEHFIPLERDLRDLDEKLKWIRDNPGDVRVIAKNGRQFYIDYLSFERNEEHIYEFVYRLASAKEKHDTKLATAHTTLNTTSIS